jgi:hypothetical protein
MFNRLGLHTEYCWRRHHLGGLCHSVILYHKNAISYWQIVRPVHTAMHQVLRLCRRFDLATTALTCSTGILHIVQETITDNLTPPGSLLTHFPFSMLVMR